MPARDTRLTCWPGGAAPPSPPGVGIRGGWCCCASRFLSLPVTPGNRFAEPLGEQECQSYGAPTRRTTQEKSDDNFPPVRLTSRQCPLSPLCWSRAPPPGHGQSG